MRSIGRLFGAFGTLADSVLALAGVIDAAAGRLRQQLALETEPTVLEHQPAEADGGGNGTTPPCHAGTATRRRR